MGASRSRASILPAAEERYSSPVTTPARLESSPSIEYLLEKWVESPNKSHFVQQSPKQSTSIVEKCMNECREARIREENCLTRILETLGETEEEAMRRQWLSKRRKVLDTVGVNNGLKKTQSTASGKVRISLHLDIRETTSNQHLRSPSGRTPAVKASGGHSLPTMGTELQIAWDEEISPTRGPTSTSLRKRTMDSSSAFDWLVGETLVMNFAG